MLLSYLDVGAFQEKESLLQSLYCGLGSQTLTTLAVLNWANVFMCSETYFKSAQQSSVIDSQDTEEF